MSMIAFLSLLSFFAVVTTLIVQAIKKVIDEKENRSYNLIALGVSLVVGFIGTLLYFYMTGVAITIQIIIFAILMGIASGLVAMNGFDKVKEAIEQLGK